LLLQPKWYAPCSGEESKWTDGGGRGDTANDGGKHINVISKSFIYQLMHNRVALKEY